jgi:hypothetical protein
LTSGSWKWIGTTPRKVLFGSGTVIVAVERPSAAGTCGTCSSFYQVTITGYLTTD